MNNVSAKIMDCHANLQADPPPDAIQRVQALDSNPCLTGNYYLNIMFKNAASTLSELEAAKKRVASSVVIQNSAMDYYLVREWTFASDTIDGPHKGLPENFQKINNEKEAEKYLSTAASGIQLPSTVYKDGKRYYDKIYVNVDSLLKTSENVLTGLISSQLAANGIKFVDKNYNGKSDPKLYKVFKCDLSEDIKPFLVDTQKIFNNCGKCAQLGQTNNLVCKKLLDWEKWQLALRAKYLAAIANSLNASKKTKIPFAPVIDENLMYLTIEIIYGPTIAEVTNSFYNIDYSAWKGQIIDPDSVHSNSIDSYKAHNLLQLKQDIENGKGLPRR